MVEPLVQVLREVSLLDGFINFWNNREETNGWTHSAEVSDVTAYGCTDKFTIYLRMNLWKRYAPTTLIQ